MRVVSTYLITAGALVFFMTGTRVCGQSLSSGSLLERQSATATESVSHHGREMFSVVKEPVTIKFKNGDVWQALLLGADANSVTIEVKNEILKIDLETIESIIQGARRVDQFFDISFNAEAERLDSFAYQLQQTPDATGYIIVYGRKGRRPIEAKKHADRDKGYLIEESGIDPKRLVSLDHCFRARFTVELWIVPRGSMPPTTCSDVKEK